MSGQSPRTGVPAVGFNHNVAFKGRTFHVQTEDSWPQQGHAITQLFIGGNVIASTKTSYVDDAGRLDPAGRAVAVRKLMEEQHKGMMRALLAGTYDVEIARQAQGAVYAPGVLAAGERAPELLVGGLGRGPVVGRTPTPTPRSVPPAPSSRPLDELVLSYLLADLDQPRR